MGGQEAIDMLDKLIEESRISHYVVTKILGNSDPENYKEMLPKICYVLCLTKVERKTKHTIPLTQQLYKMPLDELICHCLLVFEETEENLESENKEASRKNVKRRKALRMHLNELNSLILYFYKCLQIYLNRRKDIFIMLGEEETDGVAIQEFNQEYFNDEGESP